MQRGLRQVAIAAVCGGALFALLPPRGHPIDTAYVDGHVVRFTVAPAHGRRPQRVGPWSFGERVADSRPRDRRLNLYLVVPGKQHQARGWEPYDMNCVLSAVPRNEGNMEWDVYWAVVLDPALRADIRSEQQIIMSAQSGFYPADLLEFDDIPSEGFLRTQLKIDGLGELAELQREDGTLPRLVIRSAGFAVRAAVEEMEPSSH